MTDCLYEAMDLDGLMDALAKVERGEIKYHARDTTEPSPFAHEMINSKPYTFLDDAPLEERRARAVVLRRTLPENARDLGVLDLDAIALVREEASPQPRDPEELHDLLLNSWPSAPTLARTGRPGSTPSWTPAELPSSKCLMTPASGSLPRTCLLCVSCTPARPSGRTSTCQPISIARQLKTRRARPSSAVISTLWGPSPRPNSRPAPA